MGAVLQCAGKKWCPRCWRKQRTADFHVDRREPDGRQRWCKTCRGNRNRKRPLRERLEDAERCNAGTWLTPDEVKMILREVV
jgi:hypothetical protein